MGGRRIELRVPDLGETESIEIIEWRFQEGDAFQEGDELCELVTDKAAFSLEAPEAGSLDEILVQKGSVKTGQVVGFASVE